MGSISQAAAINVKPWMGWHTTPEQRRQLIELSELPHHATLEDLLHACGDDYPEAATVHFNEARKTFSGLTMYGVLPEGRTALTDAQLDKYFRAEQNALNQQRRKLEREDPAGRKWQVIMFERESNDENWLALERLNKKRKRERERQQAEEREKQEAEERDKKAAELQARREAIALRMRQIMSGDQATERARLESERFRAMLFAEDRGEDEWYDSIEDLQ